MFSTRDGKFLKGIFWVTAVVVTVGTARVLFGLASTPKRENISLESCQTLCYPNTVYSVEYGHCKCNPAVNVKQ